MDKTVYSSKSLQVIRAVLWAQLMATSMLGRTEPKADLVLDILELFAPAILSTSTTQEPLKPTKPTTPTEPDSGLVENRANFPEETTKPIVAQADPEWSDREDYSQENSPRPGEAAHDYTQATDLSDIPRSTKMAEKWSRWRWGWWWCLKWTVGSPRQRLPGRP